MTTLTTRNRNTTRPRLSARNSAPTGRGRSTRQGRQGRGHRDPHLAAIHARFPITPLGDGPLSLQATPTRGRTTRIIIAAACLCAITAVTAVTVNARDQEPTPAPVTTIAPPPPPLPAPLIIPSAKTGATAPATTTIKDPK